MALAIFPVKTYQPDREDLKINTEWGVSPSRLTEDEARSQGRVLFQGRWVYPSEQRELTTQRRVYAGIRLSAALFFLLGLIEVIAIGTQQTPAPSTARLLAGLAFAGIIYFWLARGLWKFRRWAWQLVLFKYVAGPALLLSVMLFVLAESWLSTGRPFTARDTVHEIVVLFVVGLMAFISLIFFGTALLNRTARRVFRKHR